MVVKNNVKLVIDSDAPHHPVNLAFLRFGMAQVTSRGWADKSDILNTLQVDIYCVVNG